MPKSKASFGEVWKVPLSLSFCGTELAKRDRGSRRTTEKDGGGDEDAAGSAGKRMQMAEKISQRWNKPKRRRQS